MDKRTLREIVIAGLIALFIMPAAYRLVNDWLFGTENASSQQYFETREENIPVVVFHVNHSGAKGSPTIAWQENRLAKADGQKSLWITAASSGSNR